MDSNQPVIANNVGQLIQSVVGVQHVEFESPDGTTITLTRTPGNDPSVSDQAAAASRAAVERHGAVAGLPGQRSKWTKEAYKDLIANGLLLQWHQGTADPGQLGF